MSEQHAEREQRVTPLELFFDLVFVFAFTQVTTVLSDDPTWRGLGHGLLILGALWWVWAAYAWLTNTVDPGDGAVIRVTVPSSRNGVGRPESTTRSTPAIGCPSAMAPRYGSLAAVHRRLGNATASSCTTFSAQGLRVPGLKAAGMRMKKLLIPRCGARGGLRE